MIAIPAVDLRDGMCVQLEGGSYEAERVRLADPVKVARDWASYGFSQLHVVDLDAATGAGDNRTLVDAIVAERLVDVQVGGGVRSHADVQRLIDGGAIRAVVGTRAVEDLDWLAELSSSFPGAVVLAADVRGRNVVTRGWTRTLPLDVTDLVEELAGLPLAAILVTAVHLEGQLSGTDLALMEDVVEAASAPVIASGGVTSIADLYSLEQRGVAAAVIGMALYTGTLDPWQVAQEFGA